MSLSLTASPQQQQILAEILGTQPHSARTIECGLSPESHHLINQHVPRQKFTHVWDACCVGHISCGTHAVSRCVGHMLCQGVWET